MIGIAHMHVDDSVLNLLAVVLEVISFRCSCRPSFFVLLLFVVVAAEADDVESKFVANDAVCRCCLW